MKTYYEKNKERIKAKQRENYEKNKEKILVRRRELYAGCNSYSDETTLLKYIIPDSKNKKKKREYYYKNKERINKKHKEYNYDKYNSDPQFRAKTKLRVRLKSAVFKDYGVSHTEPLLGCSMQEFRKHIESQFAPGMNWDNYGRWEFDHINPVMNFDLTDEEQIKLCYYYVNLRPMWSSKNRMKSKQCYFF